MMDGFLARSRDSHAKTIEREKKKMGAQIATGDRIYQTLATSARGMKQIQKRANFVPRSLFRIRAAALKNISLVAREKKGWLKIRNLARLVSSDFDGRQ